MRIVKRLYYHPEKKSYVEVRRFFDGRKLNRIVTINRKGHSKYWIFWSPQIHGYKLVGDLL